MKKTSVSTFIFLTVLTACAMAQTPTKPILDLSVGLSGKLEDTSGVKRDIEIRHDQLKVNADKSVTVEQNNSLIIPYEAGDPLFGEGAFTWIIKCKFQDALAAQGNNPIVGRWDPSTEKRVAGLVIESGKGAMQVLISPDGSAESTTGTVSPHIPNDQWIYLVAKYLPGSILTITMYDESGQIVEKEGAINVNIPPSAYAVDTNFILGAPSGLGMSFTTLRIWNSALTTEAIQAALHE